MRIHYYADNFLYALLIVVSLACLSLFISDTKNLLEVLVYPIKLIPMAIVSLLSLLSRIIFTGTARFLVLVINALQETTQAFQSGLQLLTEWIKSLVMYLLELSLEIVNSLVSAAFELLKEVVSKFCEALIEGMKGLAEEGKEGIGVLSEVVKEIVGSIVEMVVQVISDLWTNYKEAVSYVTEQGK